MLRVRLPDNLDVALDRLKKERHVNVSAWVRAALQEALKHELQIGAPVPPPPALLSAPIPGGGPGSTKGTGAKCFEGDTRALPADLVGQVSEIETQAGETWQGLGTGRNRAH